THPVPPPNCVHSRTYTGLPSTGSPLTVADRLLPGAWLYTFALPGPVVPTYSAYCVAPPPASHVNVTPALGKVAPGAGFVTTALAEATSSTSTQSSFPGPSALLPGVWKSREPAFANGDPAMFVNVPAAGSYHRAVTGPLSMLMSTVTVRAVGT